MATRDTLTKRVARLTARSNATDITDVSTYNDAFTGLVYSAFDEFMQEVCMQTHFREMEFEDSISISADDYNAALPTSAQSGFESTIHKVLGGFRLRYSTTETWGFHLRSRSWFENRFPDRDRAAALSARPLYGAIIGSDMHWQSPADNDYTLYMRTSHVPDADVFADGSGTTSNPIADLDSALVQYARSVVFDSVGKTLEAEKALGRAYALASMAGMQNNTDPGIVFQASLHGLGVPGADSYLFDYDDLKLIYPEP